jgi:hypothetical protein
MLPEDKTVSALKALYKYNFAVDAGLYKKKHRGRRTFAASGEAGLYICTWPKGEGEIKHVNRSPVDLFSECMHGFEYQAAGHMIFEGLVQEGLAVTRSIHDRYHPSKRNPWNEIECGEHYARSMASYGVFIAACGFEYHGPKGHLGFAPRLTPEDFKAAFTAAEGWGTIAQRREGGSQKETIAVKWGTLRLRSLAFAVPADAKPSKAAVTVASRAVEAALRAETEGRVVVTLGAEATVAAGQAVEVTIG